MHLLPDDIVDRMSVCCSSQYQGRLTPLALTLEVIYCRKNLKVIALIFVKPTVNDIHKKLKSIRADF